MLYNKQSRFNCFRKRFTCLTFIIVALIFFCSNVVYAAVISGSIYDLALQSESNVIVEINTIPKQLLVSTSGDYAFNVKPGNYTLYAHTSISASKESIAVVDDGNYTLDIILGESLTDLTDLGDFTLKESDINVSLDTPKDKTNSNTFIILIGIVLVIVIGMIGLYLFIYSKKNKPSFHESTGKHEINKHNSDKHNSEDISEKPLDEYEHKVLSLIKKEKRTTQKDLRKEVPLSEAKISLIISDLESKGMVRKIKKGRGNILIFVKD